MLLEAEGAAQVVKYLPNMCKNLGSILYTAKKSQLINYNICKMVPGKHENV
jgi:hypothetical protein